MCVQLARAETPEGANFVALGAPDAGVECYCVLDDNTEWGWQAKFFLSSLKTPQWRQLDDSVKRALDKHPALVQYFICIAGDRPDPRKPDQKWEMDQWNDHVSKWQGWAQDRSMDVEFVWWGSSELLEKLSQNEHIGHRFFWFGQRGFDQEWFRYHLDEAVDAAGPRYTPEVHVNLPIAQDMERFGRSGFLFDEVKSLAIEIRRAHTGLMSAQRSLEKSVEEIDIDELSEATGKLLGSLSHLEPSPIGFLPFVDITNAADEADKTCNQALGQVWKLQRQREAQNEEDRTSRTYHQEPFGNLMYYLQRLASRLREAVEICKHAHSLANGQLLLLKGDGGTGKTHLLRDFAKKRLDSQLPTVLLLGKWFRSEENPWIQLLQKLDLPETSAEQFVGALEAAAQAAGCRALVMIDALNEGNGRNIWLAHLSSFLTRLEKSPWVGVVLSFRSSYEEAVVPENVRVRAVHMTHYGFNDHEYDAVQTFFEHYGLEFPSAPILQPEFRNPLFLTTICEGLRDKGETRIPRGFQGITAVFDLYLETVNRRLAANLDYNRRDYLVREALDRLSRLLIDTESRWLPRPQAEEVVNELLPGRDFSRSLYNGLVIEGVLVEDKGLGTGNCLEEVVFIAYDRFADHIIADFLLRNSPTEHPNPDATESKVMVLWRLLQAFLRTRLNIPSPKARLAHGGGLAFLQEGKTYVRQGLLEALCVQVPERTGQELVRIAPKVLNSPGIGDAFLESIVWRRLDAFSEDTRAVLKELIEDERIWRDPLDALLSVSTVPDHPFNANFLDQRLRQDSMPDRDSWWSTYLHRVWGTQSLVDRLVVWASGLSSDDDVEDSVVDLSATTLAWMLTTPNRFLRDRATKALVSLLTGRPESTVRLLDRFADVDDPYISERVYAVAYGVAMRSHDSKAIGELASLVYEKVFASGTPPAHILLRDYARGVVERSIHLGADIQFNEQSFRPPYKSTMPSIPCEDCVEGLFPGWEKGAWEGGDLEWSRNRIRWSVLGDDFAHYVIRGDSSSNWMSLALEEEPWQSPDERRQALLLELNESELLAWDEFQRAKAEMPPIVHPLVKKFVDAEGNLDDGQDFRFASIEEETYEQARLKVELLHGQLMAKLTEQHRIELELILRDENEREGREGPRFDKRLIQRYIIWRVFDLGWTIERFGRFDRFDIGYSGRDAAKPERIGKKYQWIAYYETLAYISDHFQYRERWGAQRDYYYEGPYQEGLRDIDPSFTLLSKLGGTSRGPHNPSWWGKGLYDAWCQEMGHRDWLSRTADIPEIEQFLQVVHPTDGTRWLNVNGYLVWQQPHPADVDPFDVVRREISFICIGYFIKESDLKLFAEWANSAKTIQLTNPGSLDLFGVFLGEYGWSPAFKYFAGSSDIESESFEASDGTFDWSRNVRPACQSYHAGISSFDCSADDANNLLLPHPDFINRLGLKWCGTGSDYLDKEGKLATFDPTAHEHGPTALLLREDLVKQYLAEEGLTLCWAVVGEKCVIGGRSNHEFHGALKIRGVFQHTDQGPDGQLRFQTDIPESNEDLCSLT